MSIFDLLDSLDDGTTDNEKILTLKKQLQKGKRENKLLKKENKKLKKKNLKLKNKKINREKKVKDGRIESIRVRGKR